MKVAQMEALKNPDLLLRTVAMAVLPALKKRVHVDGKASDGSAIGTYSKGYMVLRTGGYQNADRVSKGKNKGKLKNAGTFTDRGEEKAGKARPKYNRTADTKVIVSLTRQTENDLSVVAAGGGYGLGYLNPHNFDKSKWVVETYKKEIWKLSKEEKELVIKVAEDFVQQNLPS